MSIVYAKPPFGGPSHVLHYLARYTHRVAISNHRAAQNRKLTLVYSNSLAWLLAKYSIS